MAEDKRINGNPVCSGCDQRIELDDDVLRPGDIFVHDRPECIAKRLEKLASTPPPQEQ